VSVVLKAATVFVFGLVTASPAQGQEAAETQPLIGERVRVRHCNASGRKSPDGKGPCFRTEGDLLAVTPDLLRVEPPKGAVRDVPRAEVQRLERFLGTRRNTGRGALIGGGIGAGLGLLFGVLVAAEEQAADAVAALVVGAPLAAGAVGALIGAGIGALPKERWTDVAEDRWKVTAVGGGGQVGLGLRMAF